MSKQKRRQTEQTEPIEQNQTPDGGETLDQAEQPVQEAPEQEEPAERPDPLAESQAQYQQLNDKYLRTLAEYDNYRKRSQKEREGVFGDAQAMTAGLLLPVLDNLDLT